ncbi:MAG: integral rane sensor signal transduction histidine kinase [Cyanobacteria bacterium RYN_339]|nr:integral rane sensor signal transduction histidine kinase [Cyanobacteria bacterium RYN_339]
MWYAGVFAAILLVFGVAMYAYLAMTLMRSVDDVNARALVTVLESVKLDSGSLSVDMDDFRHEVDEVRMAYNIQLVRIFTKDGRVLAEGGRQATVAPPAGAASETRPIGRDEMRLLRHSVVANGRTVGTVLVGRPLNERNEALEGLARALLLAIPTAVGATLLAGALLANKALRPIQVAFERQRQFIADASHELRTPLSVILAQSEVGQQGDQADARRALGTVERTARRMGALVADMLLLTRADAATLALDRRRFYLDELAEQIVSDMAPLALERGVELRVEVTDPDLAIVADPEKLQQLLTILVDNALTHTPSHGSVVVRAGRSPLDAATAELGVTDTGCGIAPEALPRIFDRFFRADPARSGAQRGSGLGLAIARAIAAAHGGVIKVESEPQLGSTFRCLLPLDVG